MVNPVNNQSNAAQDMMSLQSDAIVAKTESDVEGNTRNEESVKVFLDALAEATKNIISKSESK